MRRTLWGWFAVGLVFLSIGESKLLTYALPLFPILALIVGEHLATRSSRGFGYIIHVAALALLPALGLVALKVKFGEARPFLWTAVLLLGLAVVLIGRHARRSPSADALIDGIARMSVLALLGLMLVAPRAAAWMTGRDLAATFNAAGALRWIRR